MSNLLKYDDDSEWHVRLPIIAPLRRLLWFSCSLYLVCLACFVVLAFAYANYELDCDNPIYYYPGSTLIEESDETCIYTTDASYNKVYDFFDNKLTCNGNRCSGLSENGNEYVVEFAPEGTSPTHYTLKVYQSCRSW